MKHYRYLTFNFSKFASKAEAHRIMKEKLDHPDYIGNNLDALHDVLTTVGPTKLTVRKVEEGKALLGDYIDTLLRVLQDSAEENENLKVYIRK